MLSEMNKIWFWPEFLAWRSIQSPPVGHREADKGSKERERTCTNPETREGFREQVAFLSLLRTQ